MVDVRGYLPLPELELRLNSQSFLMVIALGLSHLLLVLVSPTQGQANLMCEAP